MGSSYTDLRERYRWWGNRFDTMLIAANMGMKVAVGEREKGDAVQNVPTCLKKQQADKVLEGNFIGL